jgi:hypothetical protein
VFWGEAVVNRHEDDAGVFGDGPAEDVFRVEVAHDKPTAMRVKADW